MVQLRHDCDCETCDGSYVPVNGAFGGWRCTCQCHQKDRIERFQKKREEENRIITETREEIESLYEKNLISEKAYNKMRELLKTSKGI